MTITTQSALAQIGKAKNDLRDLKSLREAPALAQACVWRSWASQHAAEHAHFESLLPTSTRAPDFRLARALLKADLEGQSRIALAMSDAWQWSPSVVALRYEALEAPARDALRLAASMMDFPEAPWRRWACASAEPQALFKALGKLGHREPAIANLGAASLPCLMGFSGYPCHEWIKTVSQAGDAASFASCSHGFEYFLFFQDLFPIDPSAFPDLPPRPMQSEQYSRCCDAMDLAKSTPAHELVFASLGIELRQGRPCPQEPFSLILSTPFFARLLGTHNAELPADTENDWPLHTAITKEFYQGQRDYLVTRKLIGLGARFEDKIDGLSIWEHVVRPSCETGSEGWYAPIDHDLISLLAEHVDSFEPLGLIGTLIQRPGKPLPPLRTLADFYQHVLPPERARDTVAMLAPWIAIWEARTLSKHTPEAPSKPRDRL